MPISVQVTSPTFQPTTPDAPMLRQLARENEQLARAVEQLSQIIEARS